jgi:glycosyltransferase involved in cell wall biosynthesis
MTPPHFTSVTAVIPAYNERGRLRNVLAVVRQVPDFREIIVVDDGSTDGTELDVQEWTPLDHRIRYLRLAENQGKVRAMQAGVEATESELIVFLDADLYQMTPETVRALILPVRDRQAEMTVGVFRGGKWYTDVSQRVGPWLSGQRCLPRDLFFLVPLDQVVGYGIEAAFTIVARQRRWRVKHVPLWGAYQQSTEVRRGTLSDGIRWKGRMFQQIIQTFLAIWIFSNANKRKLDSLRRMFLS